MADLDHHSPFTLPLPTLTFTLPSLHDGLPLDCRVYHSQPLAPSLPKNLPAQSWQRHAAIVAHPYAPLGGCFDDPVVDIVASTLLRLGFLVMTFNFRGAHGSAGRTSWTAKAERADYMTAVGFVSHYVHFLDPFRRPPTPDSGSGQAPTSETPILLLSGYSYGAMITTQLPSLPTILAPFDTPMCGSPAAEIRLRAQHLAERQNTILASARAAVIDRQSGRSPRKSLGLRIGGDEENRRKSHDSRHSFALEAEEKIRKGVADLMTKARKGQKRRHVSGEGSALHHQGAEDDAVEEKEPHQEPAHDFLLPVPGRTVASPAYLLVSPLQGVITNLATMSFPAPFARAAQKPAIVGKTGAHPGELKPIAQPATLPVEAEEKLVRNPTLAVYGDRDGFVPARKLRQWASRLQEVPDSKFRAHEVSNAGHFWAQGKVAFTMRDAVQTFAEGLLSESHGS
ncbi:Alpha/Beta hydrolase protein [Apodospora peruviana]|uniref:Alpha/Beta hydrolase protein n=1 Tax=Apodospora peruviana TaxID=516989 RepID=A0AAE0IBC8_9PEZI|nr:Alpha/Beta hydrolase protein [Apodospora peruviana]